jgi:hypothetical protein
METKSRRTCKLDIGLSRYKEKPEGLMPNGMKLNEP